jgi:hypothetical protein
MKIEIIDDDDDGYVWLPAGAFASSRLRLAGLTDDQLAWVRHESFGRPDGFLCDLADELCRGRARISSSAGAGRYAYGASAPDIGRYQEG